MHRHGAALGRGDGGAGRSRGAARRYQKWRRTPPGDRIQPLFKLKALLEQHWDEVAQVITEECGKTLGEAEGELRRGIENVEVATGIPSLMMGSNLEDIASGIDELMIRQPVGVVAAITPFNFPGMIPLWFLPYAVACGNTLILKPSREDADDDGPDLSSWSSRPASRPASSTWSTAARTRWTRCSITRTCARSRSSARRRSRATSTAAPPPTASARSARAAPRTRSSSCPTPTWR